MILEARKPRRTPFTIWRVQSSETWRLVLRYKSIELSDESISSDSRAELLAEEEPTWSRQQVVLFVQKIGDRFAFTKLRNS
jgi:hypothetical protein